MTKIAFVQILQRSEMDARLGLVVDKALALIRDSPTFRWGCHSDQLEYGREASFLHSLYCGRLEWQRKRGHLIEGIQASVQSFADAHGPLAAGIAEIEGGFVVVWLDKSQKIVGCILPRSTSQ
jgi:hypothetical protein